MRTLRILIIALISVVTLLTSCRRKNEDPIPVITNNNTSNNNNTNTTDTTSKNYIRSIYNNTLTISNKIGISTFPLESKQLVVSDTTYEIISISSTKNLLTNLIITLKGVNFDFDTTKRVDLNDVLVITFKTTNIVGKQNTLVMNIPVLIRNNYQAVQEEAPRFSSDKNIQYFSKTDGSVKYIVQGFFVNKQNRHSYVSAISVSKPELFNIRFDSSASTYIIGFVNNIITYEVPVITITVSDGKLSSTETYPEPSNFGTAGSNEAYFIMRPYLDKQIKSITASNIRTATGEIYNTTYSTPSAISWGSKNYDKTVATPNFSYQELNGGSQQKVWYIDENNKLFYGNYFGDPNAIRGTITKTANGFSLYNDISKVTFTFNY
jgi:hypothetical protein